MSDATSMNTPATSADAGTTNGTAPGGKRGRLTAWVAVGGAVLLTATLAAAALTRNPGANLIRGTIWLSLLWYFVAVGGMIRSARPIADPTRRTLRWCWTHACVSYLVHVACAFHLHHHWSHREAFEHVRAGSGVGEGVYVSYLFTAAWAADAAWWWLAPMSHATRPGWVGAALHAFLAFILFNGAVVFESGAVRVAGGAGFVLLAVLWVSARARLREGKGRTSS
jgi:hypothetical protein